MDWTVSVGKLRYGYLAISKYIDATKVEFMYGGYLPALVLPILVGCMLLLLDKPMDWQVLLIAYFLPLIVYRYDYYKDLEDDASSNPERAGIMGKKARAYPAVLSAEMLMLAALLAMFANVGMAAFSILVLLSGFVYTNFLKDVTRVIIGFKSVYTSLIWAASGTLIPLFLYPMDSSSFFIFAFTFVFIKCLANVIFFDIKDMKADREKGLKTIPVLLGKNGTIKLLHIINVLSLAPILVGVYFKVIPSFALTWLALSLYVFYYLYLGNKSDEAGIRFISHALVDPEFVFWPILLLMGKIAMSAA